MGKFLKYFALFLLGLILVGWVYVQGHQPILRGKLEVDALKDTVRVYYDDFGVPHIYASNVEDAYKAFGFVHAQDRLFQMDMMRRAGAGRLSEIIGPDTKKADAFFRTIGTNRKAKADAEKFNELPEKVQALTQAYLEGVNAYIAEGHHPFEYKILQVDPQPFTVEDVYRISGFMAYSFAYALRTDPLIEDISSSLGDEYLHSLDLGVVNDVLVLPDTSAVDSLASDSLNAEMAYMQLTNPNFPQALPLPNLQGSNSWALGSTRTLSGKVMLTNDTHIKYAAPGTWYEAHIEYPGVGFYGNFIAGIPVALVGHSRNHAWGVTMFEDDDMDFYYEQFTDADRNYTVYKDSLKAPVNSYEETITVKGGEDTVITVLETVHGVVMNDFLPLEMERPVSMLWNYTNVDNRLLDAFYRMNRADKLSDFRRGVELIGSPGLNITYGDAAGNIAMWSAGKLIKRSDSTNGKHFADGTSAFTEMQGHYDFKDNPQVVNPASDFVVSANQMHDTTRGVLYPGYYAPNTRAKRITELLKDETTATTESMQKMMLDVVSTTESETAHEMVKVIRASNEVMTDLEEQAMEKLAGWSGSHKLRDEAPTVYYKTLYYVLKNLMSDELGMDKFEKLLNTHFIKRNYPLLIASDASPWWDDVLTESVTETRELLLVKSFKRAVMELGEELGEDVDSWDWERVHFIEHPHFFTSNPIMKPIFDLGPYPSPGGNETINNGSFIFNGNGTYTSHYGPAMRIVIDFADVENATSILPAGNSGNVMSSHYGDQAEMFVNGKFRKMMMNKKEIEKLNDLLILFPSQKEAE